MSLPRIQHMPLARLMLLVLLLLSARPIQAFTLITFDVDGTLVSSSGWAESAHGRAYPKAVAEVFQAETTEKGLSEVPAVPAILSTPEFHGSTDGLILLRLARAALDIQTTQSTPKLADMMEHMYSYIASLDDEDVGRGLTVLPGVLELLNYLSTFPRTELMCGLVTGNVEGIARRKMSSVGIFQTGALSPPPPSQRSKEWSGAEHIGFLGGFGSDYCSGNLEDPNRNHLDRSEQIHIAVERCREVLSERPIRRVIHVGDAPADVLAARAYYERVSQSEGADGGDVCVGVVGVATGSYPADHLRELAGEMVEGRWEPVVLEGGLADAKGFLKACCL